MWLPIPDTDDKTVREALGQWRRELTYFENITLEQLESMTSLLQTLQKDIAELTSGGGNS